jgi:hypothetical protein
MITCIPVPWQINDRSALQSVFSSIILPPLVSSENLPLLHVNGESISLSVIYQQYQIHVTENRGNHYEWAIQRHWQPWLHKIQGEDKQNKDTGNLDYTRQIPQHKQICNTDLNKTGMNPRAHEGQAVPTSYKTFGMLLIKPSCVGHLYIK